KVKPRQQPLIETRRMAEEDDQHGNATQAVQGGKLRSSRRGVLEQLPFDGTPPTHARSDPVTTARMAAQTRSMSSSRKLLAEGKLSPRAASSTVTGYSPSAKAWYGGWI